HRDIKPENIMFRKDGRVQVMDFGLAKLRGASRLTKEGSTVGTAGYMSPEQVQGQETDHRSDIFSLGVLLYEMLTGQVPFKGMHETAISYEIVNVDSPPMSSIKPEMPPELDAIVLECLEKDANDRSQSAKQVAVDLKRYRRESSRQRVSRVTAARPVLNPSGFELPGTSESVGKKLAGRFVQLPWIAAALFFIGMIAFATMYFIRPSVNKTTVRSSLLPPENSAYSSYLGGGHFALSPDGLKLAFVATDSSGSSSLWVRPLNSLEAIMLPGTEGAHFPFWSPDNRFIAFFSSGKSKKILATGGPPSSICDVIDPRGGTWNQDGIIVLSISWNSGLYQVSAAGGSPSPVTKLDSTRREQTHRWPWFLPDGNHFLYFSRIGVGGAETENDGVFVASLDGRVNKRLFSASSNVVYASGHILFVRQSTLMAQPFDPGSLELIGEAVPVARRVGYDFDYNRGQFTVSGNGAFAYRGATATSGTELFLFDRTGRQLKKVGEPALYFGGQLSRDERKLVISVWDAQIRNRDVWVYDLIRNVRTRFTFGPGVEDDAVWSADGSRIIYSSDKKRDGDIYQKAVSGAGAEELLVESPQLKRPRDVSQDGRFLLYYSEHPETRSDVWVLPLSGEKQPIPLLQSEYDEYDPQFSPDGKWISYVSNESGGREVYVKPFTASGADVPREGKWQVSDGGILDAPITTPRWRADGRELYYVSADHKVMSVEIRTSGTTFEVGAVKELFQVKSKIPTYIVAASADGQRFLLSCLQDQSFTPLTLVLNWDDELGKIDIDHK
ncbi:MAG: prkC 26, partial [Bacteroidetes bacterium]|nr:prkC 26 [Bacteroidota bacterium]